MEIAIVAFDNFTDLDVFMPWDLLNRVRLEGHHTDWNVRLVGTESSHTSMAGLKIDMTGSIDETSRYDAVLFASGPGIQPLLKDTSYLSRFHLDPARQLIGSMCSGALLLAALGLLEGISATTYPTRRVQLSSYGITVVDQPIVTHGNISTAAGCLAAQDLSAWVIRRLVGEEMMVKVLESVQPVGVAVEDLL